MKEAVALNLLNYKVKKVEIFLVLNWIKMLGIFQADVLEIEYMRGG